MYINKVVGTIMKLTTSDLIQILGIIVALFTGIISIIISIITLCQNSKIIKQSNMAHIEIFPYKIYGDNIPRIKIQNFGKTAGNIISVKTIPEMPVNEMIINPFDFFKELTLAPNQSFITIFIKNDGSSDVPINEFDIIISYKTLGKIVEATYHINYKFLDIAFETKTSSKDETSALDKINQSLQGLQQI